MEKAREYTLIFTSTLHAFHRRCVDSGGGDWGEVEGGREGRTCLGASSAEGTSSAKDIDGFSLSSRFIITIVARPGGTGGGVRVKMVEGEEPFLLLRDSHLLHWFHPTL